MQTVKSKISITIDADLAQFLEEQASSNNVSKSFLMESALRNLREQKLIEDAKTLANLTFDDLPTEDEWLQIQSKID